MNLRSTALAVLSTAVTAVYTDNTKNFACPSLSSIIGRYEPSDCNSNRNVCRIGRCYYDLQELVEEPIGSIKEITPLRNTTVEYARKLRGFRAECDDEPYCFMNELMTLCRCNDTMYATSGEGWTESELTTYTERERRDLAYARKISTWSFGGAPYPEKTAMRTRYYVRHAPAYKAVPWSVNIDYLRQTTPWDLQSFNGDTPLQWDFKIGPYQDGTPGGRIDHDVHLEPFFPQNLYLDIYYDQVTALDVPISIVIAFNRQNGAVSVQGTASSAQCGSVDITPTGAMLTCGAGSNLLCSEDPQWSYCTITVSTYWQSRRLNLYYRVQ